MAVKSLSQKFNKAAGIDQGWKAPLGTAEDIFNFRFDPSGGWLCDRGIEPWWDPSPSFQVQEANALIQTALLGSKVDSLFVWTKQGSNQTYILVEQGGYLYYIWGNKGTTVASAWRRNIIILGQNRHIPKQNEVGTQYIPYGNRLLIINGVDKPIWFYGDTVQRDFSFTLPTPSPEVLDINPDFLVGGELGSGTAAPNFETDPLGLGDRSTGDTSVYFYRMSFITDSGSESPLSAPISLSWTIPTGEGNPNKRFGVYINDIPIGPKGTIARRIYRTKNQRLGDSTNIGEGVYYFVKQINDNACEEYIDITSDNILVNQASLTASSVIDTSYQYGAAWNGRIWLAGGLTHPTKIIYSAIGLPEQFSTFDYFDVGNEKGGSITQLYAYYNNLLVFRESSIEVIRFNNGVLSISPISLNIGTRASNTIKLVPEIGVVFLTDDGFYAISGGLDGGSQISITKISSPISKEVERISIANIQKSIATYSSKEKEYWCHYPVKGGIYPTRGAVIHTSDGSWSFRHASQKSNEKYFRWTAMDVDPDGNILIGTVPTWRTALGAPSNPTTAGSIGSLVGIHVWSGSNSLGYDLTASVSGQGVWTYTAAKNVLQGSAYESGWIDFGDNSIKHRVFSVDVEIISYGDYPINFEWGQDYDSSWYTAPSQKPSKAEILFTAKEDPVFGPANTSVTKVPFTIGKSSLKDARIIRVRWDVNTALVDNFRFKLKSDFPMHLLSFNITYDSNDQMPLNQKPRTNMGQPW